MSVLLDTSALYAFLDRDDEHHGEAKDLFLRIAHAEHGTPFVCDWVVAELFTVLRARRAPREIEDAAHQLLSFPDSALDSLRLITLGPAQLEDVWRAYEKHRARRISFTDAALLVLKQAYGIATLASFDAALAALANPKTRK